MGDLKSQVGQIAHVEELAVEKVSKIEDRVQDMEEKVAKVDTELVSSVVLQSRTPDGNGKTAWEDFRAVSSALSSGWSYLGRGTRGSYDDEIGKHGTTFPECVEMCSQKRKSSGAAWNSMVWGTEGHYCGCYKNERGHSLSEPQYMHFRIK